MREIMTESIGRLTEAELEEIEHLARENRSETYRGALLALVDEVRRLRRIATGMEVAVADSKRVAEQRLAELLMEMRGHRKAQEAYRNKGDAAGVTRSERLLKLDYSIIQRHCAVHDLELPRDVPSEDAE